MYDLFFAPIVIYKKSSAISHPSYRIIRNCYPIDKTLELSYLCFMGINENDAAGLFSPMVDTTYLVVTHSKENSDYDPQNLLEELASLVTTMGFEVKGSKIVNLREITSRFLLGAGKTEEIIEEAKDLEVDCIVFDDDLSPSQQRNWEKLSGLCVIDRQEVILDIFSARATTREAVLQVGLARMEYSLPRLTRAWTHLSRQKGGTKGTRGEGETQLEVDRRLVMRRITRMKKELKKVKANRKTMRKRRNIAHIPTASLIGYTNAGKSSLLKAFTDADILVEDKLFATLDPTTKRITLKGGSQFLLTDTVGFIRKLPHDLVESFKSTLEETRYSDFLLVVMDASSPEIQHHYETTLNVLKELEITGKPVILIFNKMDLCVNRFALGRIEGNHDNIVHISVKRRTGLPELLEMVQQMIYQSIRMEKYKIPNSRYDLVALIRRTGNIETETYEGNDILLEARIPDEIRGRLKEYLVS